MMRSDGSEAATPLPLEEEIWKDVPGYEGQYQASTLGRIRSVDRVVVHHYKDGSTSERLVKGRIKKQTKRYDGYHMIGFNHSGYTPLVHMLVAYTFLGPRPNPSCQVMHLDGDKDNNCVSNLAYGSPRENNLDKLMKHGRGCPKLRKEQVQEIRQLLASGKYTNTAIGKMYNVSNVMISRIKLGKAYKWLDG